MLAVSGDPVRESIARDWLIVFDSGFALAGFPTLDAVPGLA